MKIWKLKKGHDARLRSRHPWVFSNELLDSPKSIQPGEPVEIQDMRGQFLARGYGNPHSLISFRALSFTLQDEDPLSSLSLSSKLLKAWKMRFDLGFYLSFRICFSEADDMPGFICDRYVFTKSGITHQVFSYQLLTSGMDVAFKANLLAIFETLVKESLMQGLSAILWDQTILVQRNDVNIRKLEGLLIEPPVQTKSIPGEDLTDISIEVQNVVASTEKIYFKINLIEGQKTGFFLDQTHNMKLLIDCLEQKKHVLKSRRIKILDLCCYMGQWSSQIAYNLKKWGIDCEVHLVDISELALKKASENLLVYGYEVKTYKMDVLDGLSAFSTGDFDIVISDPPAFVKNKKDLHPGLHAYTKLNAQAFRIARADGIVISCTCSGLVTMEDFKESLRKAILKSGKSAKCLLTGGQGWDHPIQMSFPEGYYLKMVMHQLS